MKFPSSIAIGVAISMIAIFVLAWRMWTYEAPQEAETAEILSDTEVDPSSVAIYANGQLGVSFTYPETATLTPGPLFKEGTAPTPEWTTAAEITMGSTSVLVRVAQSDVAGQCPAWSPADREVDSRDIGSRTWDIRTRALLGTEHERRVVEYRSADESRCYAVAETGPADMPSAGIIAPIILAQFHGVSQVRE